MREKIAKLPKELSDVSIVAKIEGERFQHFFRVVYLLCFQFADRETADKINVQVTNAVLLLSQYNTRLSNEMEHRKKVAVMMRDFLQVQEELLTQAERNLEVSLVYFNIIQKKNKLTGISVSMYFLKL